MFIPFVRVKIPLTTLVGFLARSLKGGESQVYHNYPGCVNPQRYTEISHLTGGADGRHNALGGRMLHKIAGDERVARYYAGEVIFKEGQDPKSAYLIKSGTVELFVFRDGKRVLIDTVSAGQSFGEVGVMLNQPREMNAATTTFTELIVISREIFNVTLRKTDAIFQKFAFNLAGRLKKSEARNCNNASIRHPLVVFAEILLLHAAPFMERNHVPQVLLDYDQCLHSISRITGYSLYLTNAILQDMEEFNLLRINGKDDSRTIMLSPYELIERCNTLAKRIGDEIVAGIMAEQEYIDANTVSEMVDVDKEIILKKLAQDEIADDVFIFRKTKIMQILNDKGRRFFEKRRLKKPEEFDEIADIQFVDMETLQQVFGSIEPFKLARLLKGIDDDEVATRIKNCLSKRKRAVIETTMQSIETVDFVESAELENFVIEEIKRIKLADAKSIFKEV